MRICKTLMWGLLAGSLGTMAVAEGLSVGSVSMGGITSPQMPVLDSPTIGGSFYVPGNSAASAKSSADAAQEHSASSSRSLETAGRAASPSRSSAVRNANALSASDLSQLGDMGLLSQLDFMMDGDSLLAGNDSSASTDILLQKVLTELEDIKSSTDAAAQAAPSPSAGSAPQSADSRREAPARGIPRSHVLRFTVNGYDILRTCRTVYISDVQTDGTFLVTGDRRYQSDGKTRSETFHMLFKTDPASSSLMDYTAATAVTQDYYNPNSFMYQLTQHKNLSATRTGNFVTMRTDDDDWKLELLIDLGEKAR